MRMRRGRVTGWSPVAVAVGALLTATSAGAQVLTTPTTGASTPTVQTTTAHIVEWDIPAQGDASPGAIVVDNKGKDSNRVWFVTRLTSGGNQNVFRFTPNRSLMKGNAQWKSWDLAPDTVTTGGLRRLRPSDDRRFIFVRTATSIQRIDTQNCDASMPQTCERIEWPDQVGELNVSDMSIDDQNNVFTTGFNDPMQPEAGNYVQLLTPAVPTATVIRWMVNGGAGACAPINAAVSLPCLSGISVQPSNRYLVYYSEPGANNIGELDIIHDTVRRWSLNTLAPPDPQGGNVQQPRQLIVDRWGIVWVVTGSGHLVSLDPSSNLLRVHTIPLALASDPFGLAPDDDVVGYTDASQNKVGMLVPKAPPQSITPSSSPVQRFPTTKDAMQERSVVNFGSVPANGKVVAATITTKQDGVFVEAQLDSPPPSDPNMPNDSTSPLGITPNKGKGQGTFFYAVGVALAHPTFDRIGFVRFKLPQKLRHPRDDDDFEDGWDHTSHPSGWHMSAVDDDDDDGFENAYDLPNANEQITVADPTPLAAGGSIDYPITATSTSLALLAIAKCDDLAAQMRVDIYNSLGMLVATSTPTPGVALATVALPTAGNYTARVRNMGVTPLTQTPMLIVREPWLP